MNISRNKKVSVVMPSYNYGRYISKRLQSIARQTYPIYELIILDDASSDDSVEKIRKEMAKFNQKRPEVKIKFVKNKQNSGKVISQWIKGVDMAKGDYIWIAEADDLCKPKFLEEVMKGFDDSKVVLSYAESAIINSTGIMIAPNFKWSRDKEKTGHYKKSYIKDGIDEIREIMTIRCTIPNVSAVVFRKTPEFMKYLKEALKFTQVGDWYLYLKLLENGKISYNQKALNKFRVHMDSATGKSKKDRKHYDEIVGIHKMAEDKYNLDKIILDRMKNERARVKEKHGIIE